MRTPAACGRRGRSLACCYDMGFRVVWGNRQPSTWRTGCKDVGQDVKTYRGVDKEERARERLQDGSDSNSTCWWIIIRAAAAWTLTKASVHVRYARDVSLKEGGFPRPSISSPRIRRRNTAGMPATRPRPHLLSWMIRIASSLCPRVPPNFD